MAKYTISVTKVTFSGNPFSGSGSQSFNNLCSGFWGATFEGNIEVDGNNRYFHVTKISVTCKITTNPAYRGIDAGLSFKSPMPGTASLQIRACDSNKSTNSSHWKTFSIPMSNSFGGWEFTKSASDITHTSTGSATVNERILLYNSGGSFRGFLNTNKPSACEWGMIYTNEHYDAWNPNTPGIQRWNGSAWETKRVKKWNGSSWVDIPAKRYNNGWNDTKG